MKTINIQGKSYVEVHERVKFLGKILRHSLTTEVMKKLKLIMMQPL